MSIRLKSKTDKVETAKIRNEFKRFALYQDFKDLYEKTMIPM